MTPRPDIVLFLSDARGVYIPRDFASQIKRDRVTGISDDDYAVLDAGPDAGPAHEHYWEVWDDVLRDAVVTDSDGVKFTLHQDGDLWLIPEGMEWSDEEQFFVWPAEELEG